MKPIEFLITRHGLNVIGKFARWYEYTIFESRRYTEQLIPKWNNFDVFFKLDIEIEKYGIGIKERPNDADPDGENKRYFPPLNLLPIDCNYLIMWGDKITCNSWTKEIKNTGDIVAVLENLKLEYDLQEVNDERS
jgi:hypothetical protein